MKYLLTTLFALCFSLATAQHDDSELELLPPDAFKNEALRRDLALQGSKTVKDSSSKELLRAAVLFYDKKWDSAFSAYVPLVSKAPNLLYGPLVIRLAICEMERGNIQESRKILLSAKSIKNNKSVWEMADQILIEGIMRDTAITKNAKMDSISRRLKTNPIARYEHFLRFKLATMQEAEGDTENAIANYSILLKTKGQYTDTAFYALQKLAPASEDYDYVVALCKKATYEPCASKISSILGKANTLSSEKRINLMELQADAWKRLDKTNLAIAQYKKLLDSINYKASWLQTLLRMVRNSGDKKETRRLDSIFEVKFQFSTENINNLWARAMDLEQEGEYQKAIALFKRLYDPKYGKNQRRQWAKFRVGFISFKQEKYAEAAKIFAEAAKENLGLMPRSAALYFYAECLQMQKSNKDDVAKAYFAVIKDFPIGYYAWRSKQRLEEFRLSDSIPHLGVQMSDHAAILWLRALQKKESNEKDSIISAERLEQISILLRSGFEKEAFILYDEAFKLHINRPEFYYRYGSMFMQNGELTLGYKLARSFLEMVPREKMASAPMQVLKFIFPLPYEAKIKKHATIEPFLVLSVMRQESMFDDKITSPVGARGLLQIMPTTGDFLAKRESIKGYNKDLLYNAYMNIRLGVRYLNDFHVEYKGDYIGILGSYNAGPAPAIRWLKNYGSLPWDIRVEEVSYWETRDYVKRVLGNYWTYKSVYEN